MKMKEVVDGPAASLGRLVARAFGEDDSSALAIWATLLYAHLQEGRVYLDHSDPLDGLDVAEDEKNWKIPSLPGQAGWLEDVPANGTASGKSPLVRQGNQLWLARYFLYNSELKGALEARSGPARFDIDESLIRSDITSLFPAGPGDVNERGQRLAAASLADLRFGLLTGGPGTGKTTSLAKMLMLILRQDPENRSPILLLAPTGKAAARLKESLRGAVNKLREITAAKEYGSLLNRLDPDSADCLVTSSTIHKALGSRMNRREGQGPFWHDVGNKLDASVVIVDEVSMVDLALMARLVAAVPGEARLLFVGDAEQLESVEAGPVLPELAAAKETIPPSRMQEVATRASLPEGVGMAHLPSPRHVHLSHNYRTESAALMELARLANAGKVDEFLQTLQAGKEGIVWIRLPEGGRNLPQGGTVQSAFMDDAGYGPLAELLKAGPVEIGKAVKAFDQFRVLCALRKGPDGVEQWNRRLQQWVVGDELPASPRAVMITANDPATGLCNGDTGLILPREGSLTMHTIDQRSWPAARLPENQPGWAITIHKSQGSEYDAVSVVLPRTGGDQLLNRRLLYTAITRARKKLILLATETVLRKAVSSCAG